jgi:hypothetical protein
LSELELVRAVCEALPEPDEAAVAAARATLRREIAAAAAPARRRRLPYAMPALPAAVAVAVAVAAVLVVGSRQDSLAVRVAAAADAAVSPSTDELAHSLSRTTTRTVAAGGTTTERSTRESWWTAGEPAMTLDLYRDGTGGTRTILGSVCGSITYEPNRNLFTVSPSTGRFDPISDPVATATDALRHGRVLYRGTLVYHGIPAAKLVATQYGATTTYIVRRSNGYPLETSLRRVTSHFTLTVVTTYTLFEHLPRTPENERRLALTPRPGAFVVRTAAAPAAPGCAGFGSLDSLTGRSAR